MFRVSFIANHSGWEAKRSFNTNKPPVGFHAG